MNPWSFRIPQSGRRNPNGQLNRDNNRPFVVGSPLHYKATIVLFPIAQELQTMSN